MKISRSSTIILRPLATFSIFYRVEVYSQFKKFLSILAPKYLYLYLYLFKKEQIYSLGSLFYKPNLEEKFKATVKTIISFNKNKSSSVNLNFTRGFKNYLFLSNKCSYASRSNYSTLNCDLQGNISSHSAKDKYLNYLSLSSSIKYLDKYEDFSFKNRKIIKEKYYKKRGIYL